MIEQDTVKLLRECDSGIKMGITSIDEVIESVSSPQMKRDLQSCRVEHDRLGRECTELLHEFHDEGKDPNPMIQGMSWIKTGVRLVADRSDATVADLMTDGCNMGIKSLNRYLNEYKAADERSKDIAKRLIHLEEQLTRQFRPFL